MLTQRCIAALHQVAIKLPFNTIVPCTMVLGTLLVVDAAAGQTTLSTVSDRTVAVGGSQTTSVGKIRKTSVAEDDSLAVGRSALTHVGANQTINVGADGNMSVGKHLVIEAGDSITIKTGGASITMKKDGTIVIKGNDITIEGSGKINVKAGSDLVMKGAKILQN